MNLLCSWPLSIFDHGEQQLVNNGDGEKVGKGEGQGTWSSRNCALGKCSEILQRQLPVKHDPPSDSCLGSLKRKPSPRVSHVPFWSFSSGRTVVYLQPESFESQYKRHLSLQCNASRLLWPHDPDLIDYVMFFYEQMLKLFASIHALPTRAVWLAVNMSETYIRRSQ